MLNSKIIIVLVGIIVGIVALVISMSGVIKPTPENEDQYITKGSISPTLSNFTLSANYTSLQLLDYCSQSDSQVYNDNCLRGLWDVNDKCKNGNFSSTNSVCNDPRLGQFEGKVNVYMQDLNKSLAKLVDSCMNITSDNDIAACSYNMERIRNDCSDPRLFPMWSVCSNHIMDQFNEKYKEILQRLKTE